MHLVGLLIYTITTELHQVSIHLIQYTHTHTHIHIFVYQSGHKTVNKLPVEMTPQLKFKVPNSNLAVGDLSQLLKRPING